MITMAGCEVVRAPQQTFWSVFAENGVIVDAGANHDTAPSALMLWEGGVLRMKASVPATDRASAIAGARAAWRDLAANVDQGGSP